MNLKEKVFALIRDDEAQSSIGKYVNNFISWLIVLNIVAIIAQSYKSLDTAYGHFFLYFELFSVAIFTCEYFARLWTADLKHPDAKSWGKAALKFVFSWMGVIDLLAILPFYIPFLIKIDMRFLRILRLMRLMRIFKLQRHSRAFKMIADVLSDVRPDIMVTLFVTFILMVLSSALMYYIESEAQPEKFANIGESFWWAVATLTTVGYGDVYPITSLGKFISGIIALLGIGMVALPTGVISSAFIDRVQARKQQDMESENEQILKRLDRLELQLGSLSETEKLRKTLKEKERRIQELEAKLKSN